MNHKKNKHYKETDNKIQKTLLEIIEENKTPTITEICQRIGINRTTFYLHYVNIIDLMEVIQNEIFQSFTNSYLGKESEMTFMSYSSYELFVKHVKSHKNFYKFYFKMNTSFPLKDGYEYLWKHIIVPYFNDKNIYDEKIMELRFICFQAGFTITLKNWIDHDCHLSCQEVATILSECIHL